MGRVQMHDGARLRGPRLVEGSMERHLLGRLVAVHETAGRIETGKARRVEITQRRPRRSDEQAAVGTAHGNVAGAAMTETAVEDGTCQTADALPQLGFLGHAVSSLVAPASTRAAFAKKSGPPKLPDLRANVRCSP